MNWLEKNIRTVLEKMGGSPGGSGTPTTHLDANQVGAGTVDDTELGYLNGVTSAVQTQLGALGSADTALAGRTTAVEEEVDTLDSVVAAIAASIIREEAVVVVANTAITLSGAQTINGVAVTAGQRVLVNGQAAAKDNGIYVASNTAWARAIDVIVGGTTVTSLGGTDQAGGYWMYAQKYVAPSVGTDPLKFVFIGSISAYTASLGVQLVESDIRFNGDTVPAGGLLASKLAGLASTPAGAGVFPVANLGSGTPTGSKYLAGDGTWSTPSGSGGGGGSAGSFIPTVDKRKTVYANAQSAAMYGAGGNCTVSSPVAATAVMDTTDSYVSLNTASTTASVAYTWFNGLFSLLLRPTMSFAVKTPTTITGARFYACAASAMISTNSDTVRDNFIGFTFFPGDTNWMFTTRNGTAQTRTSTGVAVATATAYTFKIGYNPTTHTATWSINGGASTDVTLTVPVESTVLSPYVAVMATTAASRSFMVSRFGAEFVGAVVTANAGDMVGPASATSGHIPTFNGTTGKLLQDGLGVVTTVGATGSDTSVPTEQAVREAIAEGGAPPGGSEGDVQTKSGTGFVGVTPTLENNVVFISDIQWDPSTGAMQAKYGELTLASGIVTDVDLDTGSGWANVSGWQSYACEEP